VIFRLNTGVLALILFALVLGTTATGWRVGRSIRDRSDGLRDSLAVTQAALLGFMGLVLAFGLSLAVGRHEARRAAVVTEANAIGTTYLRAQTLAEPERSESLDLLERYADVSIRIARTVPNGEAQKAAVQESSEIQRQLWALVGRALDDAPEASAPRLYVEALNETFDAQTSRVAGLTNRVPTTVLLLEVVGSAIALGMLALHLAIVGRGAPAGVVAAVLVSLTLLVTFDLDRPVRGFIRSPSTSLSNVRASMDAEPAASAPHGA